VGRPKFKPGDIVEVSYLDLTSDVVGELKDAALSLGACTGYYHGEITSHGCKCTILSVTKWATGDRDGWHAIPTMLIKKIELV
jgi:hypothetical protein